MTKREKVFSGYQSPGFEELELSSESLLCASETATSINDLTEGEDTDDFTEFEPW